VKKVNGFSKRLGMRGDNPDVSIIITKRKIMWWGTWYDKWKNKLPNRAPIEQRHGRPREQQTLHRATRLSQSLPRESNNKKSSGKSLKGKWGLSTSVDHCDHWEWIASSYLTNELHVMEDIKEKEDQTESSPKRSHSDKELWLNRGQRH
jgi:hypothetical protein